MVNIGTANRSTIDSGRRSVGVVGGDKACIRAVIHHWTGHAPSTVLTSNAQVVRLPDTNRQRDLLFLLEPTACLDPWPGGPLIWVYPERGPSEPELAQMRLALSLIEPAIPAIWVLVCLPCDLDSEAASTDLDIISETLRWAIAPDVEMELEAVWLSGPHEITLSSWLAALE